MSALDRVAAPRFLGRWWPVPIALSGLTFVFVLPAPHPFTTGGVVERVLFAQSGIVLLWLAFRPTFAARVAMLVLVGASMLTRSGAFLFGAHGGHALSTEERIAGGLTWLTGYISIVLLAVLTSGIDDMLRRERHGR